MGFFGDILTYLFKGVFFAIVSGVHSGVDAVIRHKSPKKTKTKKKK